MRLLLLIFFFFNDTATTEIYTLSLHDALPISRGEWGRCPSRRSSSVGLAVALFPAVIILLLSRRLANVCPVSRLEQGAHSGSPPPYEMGGEWAPCSNLIWRRRT